MKMHHLVRTHLAHKISTEVNSSNTVKFVEIPAKKVEEILFLKGYRLADEDGSVFEAMFLGENSSATIHIATLDGQLVENTMLFISWYRFPSGVYEIVAYLS